MLKRNYNKKGQEENEKFSNLNFSAKHKSTKAQEEIVGFALIIIIVAVVLLFLLSFSLNSPKKESIESYEADNFLQSALQYTSKCEISSINRSVQNLIFDCVDNEICSNEINSCEVLNSTLREISGESWKTGENNPLKGYELRITENDNEVLGIKEGNITENYKGALQELPGRIKITFKAYY